jgi:hypothetical protein
MVIVSEPAMPSPASEVMRWSAQNGSRGKWADPDKIALFVNHIVDVMVRDGTPEALFAEKYPEALLLSPPTPDSSKMTVVHAACVLDPKAACPLLIALSRLPGFDPERRTKNGITPLIVAVYNNSSDRVKIARTLLSIGANPNSPADAREGARGKVVQRKPALAHLFHMKNRLFNMELLRTRKFVDTDLAKVLIEAGAHCGAAFQNRPATFVQEHRGFSSMRYKDGHCLPFNQVIPRFKDGHVWRYMRVVDHRSESNKWLDRLFRNHGQPVKVTAQTSYSVEDTINDRLKPSDIKIEITAPLCAWDPQVKRELRTVLMALHYCPVPVELWPDIISYLIQSPCAGFYDQTRLEKLWGRQMSPYINTGYVAVKSEKRTAAHEVCDDIAEFLHDQELIVTVQQTTLYAAVNRAKCYEFADVAAAMYGETPSMLPSSFDRILSRYLSYDTHVQNSYPECLSPEQMQHTLCRQYTESWNQASYNIYSFASHLVKQTVMTAMKRVIRQCKIHRNLDKTIEKIRARTPNPLLFDEAESVVNQWFAGNHN